MAVETATTIAGLNKLWPLGTDPRSEGDDHIRLIKSVLQATDGGALTKVAVTVLTSSGTYTKPANLKFLEVWVAGGGGGGSRAGVTGAGVSSAGGGGGGGGVAYNLYTAGGLTATVAYTVGAAGAAPGGTGSAGGNSVFGGVTASGGGGGGALMTGTAVVSTSALGAGGGASGGMLNLPGASGTQALVNMTGAGGLGRNGGGGGNHFAPGRPSLFNSGASFTAGAAGVFPGGGASGDWAGPSQATPGPGNAGGAGCVILKEYF